MAAQPVVPLLTEGTEADLGEVMTTMAQAFDPAFGEAWTRAQCSGILGLPGVWLVLARSDDKPAGFALARVVLDEAELLLLAVRPHDRHRGIGTALLTGVFDGARRRGAIRLHLEMRDGNPAARLYTRAGLIEVGRRRHYYRGDDGRQIDALTYSRQLGAP